MKKFDKHIISKPLTTMIEKTKFRMLHDKLIEENIDLVNLDLYILDKNNNLVKNVDEETGHINISLLCEFYDENFDNWINEQRTQKFIESIIKKKKDIKPKYITDESNINLKEYLFYKKKSVDNPDIEYIFGTEIIAIDLLRWCSKEYMDLCEDLLKKYKL
jgi:hypothetical protein